MAAAHMEDVEKYGDPHGHLTNSAVRSLAWDGVTVEVTDRQTNQQRAIIDNCNGIVHAGELMALMGPSGSGKTTLLDVLAHRNMTSKSRVNGRVLVNGTTPSLDDFRKISSYVEQDDALIGSLTVEETLYFTAQLSLPNTISSSQRIERIQALLASFGLQKQASTIIGTPIRKGISGGQKRRVSVASQLVTSPKLLFLDEPTSGLDSAASYEVISFVRGIVKRHNILVIASIHQPSTTTFELFDKLLLLSHGRTVYNGFVNDVPAYFQGLGYNIPQYMNPAEYIIDLVNTDFSQDAERAERNFNYIQASWSRSRGAAAISRDIDMAMGRYQDLNLQTNHRGAPWWRTPVTLTHRAWIKSYRDVIAYGVRFAMYTGLAILMGTVWLRLTPEQKNIQAFINCLFFGGAFMSFMAVASIPSFLEDRAVYVKERSNGLYGPTAFMISNFIIGIPYLFLITMTFCVIAYWLSNFAPSGAAFFTWVLWLFLDLLAAESLVVLLSSLLPIFVVALAATAFANGLWMCVGGFLVAPQDLNVFWRYVFHYIDYQAYVFRGMMVNEFGRRTYSCGEGCRCMYPSALERECKIDGNAVLAAYGYKRGDEGKWVGIMIAIIVVYRLLGWLSLYLKKR